jgi:hypothetical protein
VIISPAQLDVALGLGRVLDCDIGMIVRAHHICRASLRGGIAALFAAMLGVGPLGLMQVVAWGGMLWSYSLKEQSLARGVSKTFDGEHPCSMCKKIGEVSKEEQKQPAASTTAARKADWIAPVAAAELGPQRRGDFSYPACAMSSRSRGRIRLRCRCR